MQHRILHDAGTLRCVRDFLVANDIPIAAGSLTPLVARLSATITALENHASDQDARRRAAKAGTQGIHTLVRTLREEYLRPISRIAPTLFQNDPALRAALALPRIRDYQRLIVAAFAVADHVDSHASRFVEYGLAADLAARVRAVAVALQDRIGERGHDLGRRAAATAGQYVTFREGRQLVRLIDGMVTPRLRHLPSKLAEWRSVSRFSRRTRGERFEVIEAPSRAEVLSIAA